MSTEHPFIQQLKELNKRLDEIKSIVLNKSESKPVYNNLDFNELFGISNSTAKSWRKDGKIGYTLVGNKIYYTVDDIKIFLERYHVRVKKK